MSSAPSSNNAKKACHRPSLLLLLFLLAALFIAPVVSTRATNSHHQRRALFGSNSTSASQGEDGADIWAHFCDDENCSVNCGISVQVTNPHCLAETGRRSVRIHGTMSLDYSLLLSTETNCPCQKDCFDFWSKKKTKRQYEGVEGEEKETRDGEETMLECLTLPVWWDWKHMQSLRFVSGWCKDNNCSP